MAQRWQFSDILKEYFFIRGELQNDTITGVNEDVKKQAKKDINREYQELAQLHPPFLQKEFLVRLQPKQKFDGP